MKQIKTIVHIADAGPEVFDNDVNKALAEGWKLVKREVLPPEFSGDAYYKRRYYAELEKDDAPEQLAELPQTLKAIIKETAESTVDLIGRVVDRLAGADEPEGLPPAEAEETEERDCWNCHHSLRSVNAPPCCDCARLPRRDKWEAKR